jgi:glycosyltransferase involved in cell wall biosynthesis
MIKKKYTIAQILPALNTGGVERGVIEVSKSLIDNNFKSIVISSGGHMEAQLRRTGGTHYKLDVNSKNPFRWHKIRKELKIILKNENVDLIHLCSRAPAWIGFPLGKVLNIPVITSVHMRFRKTNFFKNIYNSILTKGETIIAISKHIEKSIKASFPKVSDKIKVIHRGVDLDLFDANFDTQIAAARIIGRKMKPIINQNEKLKNKIVNILEKSSAKKDKAENPEIILAQTMNKSIEEINVLVSSILMGINDK